MEGRGERIKTIAAGRFLTRFMSVTALQTITKMDAELLMASARMDTMTILWFKYFRKSGRAFAGDVLQRGVKHG
jgi:hypothetical protein